MPARGPAYQPSGTIGLATRDVVHSEFALALARLEKPKHFRIYGSLNYDLAHARNYMAEHFEGEYLWLMDDDHTFPPDILNRLLALRKDIVGPFVAHRKAPFPVTTAPIYSERERPGLLSVNKTGGAGLLIHRRVFEALEPPYFWHGPDSNEKDAHYTTDDEYFCKKAKEAGFDIWVDSSVVMGHLTTADIKPDWNGSQWFTKAEIAGATTFFAYQER